MKHGWPLLLCLGLVSLQVNAEETTLDLDFKAGVPQAPFNNTYYRLGFEVYLARNNLPAAWQVANKAVQNLPNDTYWLKNFAQVSEWTGHISEALTAWLQYARLTQDAPAWQAVERLARGLVNDEALLAWQQRELRLKPNSPALIQAIVASYEKLGRPLEGLQFLSGLSRSQTVLEAQAELASRAGANAQALSAYSELIRRYQPVQDNWLLQRASLLYQQGKLQEAWQGLHEAEKQMPVQRTAFWQIYAELSRLIDDQTTATRAYQVLTDQFGFDEADLINYAALLSNTRPEDAAFIAELHFRLYGRDNAAINTLSLYQRAGHLADARRFLASLTAEELNRLQHNAAFLEQRGQFYWADNQLDAAQHDYQQALGLAPRNMRLLQGLVGVLLARDDTRALRHILTQREHVATRHANLWPAWAAGWLRLQQPARALPFQQAYLHNHPEDSLALLGFADSLAQLGMPDAAEHIRARLLQQPQPTSDTAQNALALSQALRSLRLSRMPSTAIWQDWQQFLAKNPAPSAYDASQILAELLNEEAYDQARHWQENHFGFDAAPVWSSLRLALQDTDLQRIDHLLGRRLDELPIYDRIEAASRANRYPLAIQLGFDTLSDFPQDDELQRRFSDLASEHGHWLTLSVADDEIGALQRQRQQLQWSAPLSALWRVQLDWQQHQQHSNDLALLGKPQDRQYLALAWLRHSQRQDWDVRLWQDEQLTSVMGFGIRQHYRLDSQLSLGWAATWQERSEDSTPLLVGGNKNRLSFNSQWAIDGRHYLNGELSLDQYHSQYGTTLGQGQRLTLEAGHRLFADQPDQVIKLAFAMGQFTTTNDVDTRLNSLLPIGQAPNNAFFMPQDFSQWTLAWAFGQLNPQQYQRGWRSFGEVGLSVNDSGNNYLNYQLGVGGSVLGRDRLAFTLQQVQGGQNNGDSSRQLALNYRLFY